MRPRPRRSSNAARPSSASGGCAIALSPTASRKPATACSPSHGCRQVSGEAREQRTRSSVCTKSSSGGSRRRPCCRRQKRQRCCSGRCSPLVRSTCARLMVGSPSPHSPSISRLTSPPDQILSKCRRWRHQIPTPLATAPEPKAAPSLCMESGTLMVGAIRCSTRRLRCCQTSSTNQRFEKDSEVVNSWEAALRLIDRYPWHKLSPLTVHPEFCERVWAAVQNRFGSDRRPEEDWRLERWRELCASRLL